ncbi:MULTISPECIES: P-loop NTPase fold protein [Acinetobacter]|uniref:KAP NTPase domain-containing protein n=1 Tax=Acinetobacter piscicola TaxID=2006115 RepID=A0A7S6VWF5_9GAMM|nr:MULTISPECIES: P-loop NTPase fold protein [Acinetobacter]QOW46163.1 hypothetical protein G0028_09790 [Acinetobacter piscicola]
MFEILKKIYFFNKPEFRELLVLDFISEPNKHIEEYLDYYCEDKLNDYAVLINGSWGSGKTWFISRIEKKLKAKHKNVIYISLNGVAKKEVIDDEIFRFLHPFWTDKKVKFLGKVASGLVKATFKFDLNSDGSDDERVNLSIPSVNIDDILKKGENLVLIFDDVERCQIPISEVLGYINYFVEHLNSKVILIGNEDEISKKEINKNYYNEKEKIIGTTFLFNGDINSAFDSIIEEFLDSKFKEKISHYKENIIEVYNSSKYNNIRVLKQSIHEFNRLFQTKTFRDDDKLFQELLRLFLIFSIENKKHGFKDSILKFEDKDDEKKIYAKYNLDRYSKYILDIPIWSDIIINNVLDKDLISNNLERNYFSYKNEKPEWYKLWHYYDLNNIEFNQLINSSIKKLETMKYTEFGEVFHVVCAVIYFNQSFITSFDSDEVKIKGLKNIEVICSTMKRSDLNNYIKFQDKTHWGGYSYLGYDLEEIKSFIREAFEKIKEFKNSGIQEEAEEILQLLYKNSSLFLHRICLTNSADNIYFNVPILKEIKPEIFSKALLDLDSNNVRVVLSALETRYNVDKYTLNDILVEKEWLKSVLENLKYIANQRTSIEKYRIDNILISQINRILTEYLN